MGMIAIFVTAVALAVDTQTPSGEKLIQATPAVRSTDPAIKSIRVDGTYYFTMFSAAYRAPDQYALTIVDPADDTPLVVAADGQVLIYDPEYPGILHAVETGFELRFEVAGDRLNTGIKILYEKSQGSELRIDVRSASEHAKSLGKVIASKDGCRMPVALPKGDEGEVVVDLDSPQPLKMLKAWHRGGGVLDLGEHPTMTIYHVCLDEEIPNGAFHFPDAEVRNRLRQRRLTSRHPMQRGPLEKGLLATYVLRMLIRDPALRNDSVTADWRSLELDDAWFSQKLRNAKIGLEPRFPGTSAARLLTNSRLSADVGD